jgi:hypothetical protein
MTIEKLPDNLLSEARRDVWGWQCEVVQRFANNRFEVGFTTDEGNPKPTRSSVDGLGLPFSPVTPLASPPGHLLLVNSHIN